MKTHHLLQTDESHTDPVTQLSSEAEGSEETVQLCWPPAGIPVKTDTSQNNRVYGGGQSLSWVELGAVAFG